MQSGTAFLHQHEQRPFIVTWEATRACALACRHCRAEAQPRRAPDELDHEEALGLIDQAVRAKPSLFIITGGDPFMRPDLVEMIETASAQGLRVALGPSATPRLLKADFTALHRAGLRSVSLSLDAATPGRHDDFRGVRGTWSRTLQAAAKVREAGLFLQINTALSRENLDDLPALARLMDSLWPDTWSVFLTVPTGRAESASLPSPEETEAALVRLQRHAATAPYRVKTTEAPQYRRIVRQRGGGDATGRQPMLGLNDGRGFVFIAHNGDIQPSGFLPVTAGNVRAHELIDIYRDHPIFRQLRDADLLKGKCRQCEFRKLCGGSRARAYALTGDMLAQEPLCPYQPTKLETALAS